MAIDWNQVQRFALDYALPVGLRAVFVIVLFATGRAIARAVVRMLDRVLERNHVDVSLRRFAGDIAYVALLGVVVLAALDTLGVRTTAVVAVLGAAGLAIGLALQGSLSNFAAGVMLIVLRPYRVGDGVLLGKYVGRVEAIKVFHTIVITPDNRQVVIPNGQILQQPIENLTVLGRRRVDIVVTIGEVAELDVIEQQLADIAAADPRVERRPGPSAEVAEVNETGAKLYLRTWTSAESFADVTLAQLDRVRAALRGKYAKFSAAVAPP
jgi:small conductance mechanosensitive channel